MTAQTRITAGAWRGRVLDTPRGREVRPTTSMVRQAMFNILGEAVVDAAVVDLYAGSGALGFEALSRGAAAAVFVEHDRGVAALVRATAERLGCADRCRVVVDDAVAWARRNPGVVATTDLCLVDAPYRDDGLDALLEVLGAAPPALLVCEHHRARRLPETVGGLHTVRRAVYGTTQLTFMRRREPGHPA